MKHKKNKIKNNRIIKALFFCIVLIISLSSVSAISWKEALDDFFSTRLPLLVGSEDTPDPNAGDIYGWYNNTDVANIALWELIMCSSDLAPEVETVENSVSEESTMIYTTTITLTALKSYFNETDSLYEVSWYFYPLNFDSDYRVYLEEEGGDKYYLLGNNDAWTTVYAVSSDSDYVAFYSQRGYVKAVLEYTDGDMTRTFEVSVVEKEED